MIIYKTTNLVNNKIYIGKDSKNNPNYLGSGLLLQKSIIKYGVENFKKEVLEKCQSPQEMSDKEIYWIEYFNATDRTVGYNISLGGTGGDNFTNNPNKETIRKKMSSSSKGRKMAKETIEKLRIASSGRKHTEEAKEKISVGNKGCNKSGEKNSMFGKKHKDESKYKMSIAKIGKKASNVTKEKQIISRSKSIIMYDKEFNYLRDFTSIKLAGITMDICESSIIRCCKGKLKTAGGYKWKYKIY